MKRRTDTTRALSVRVNSKRLAEILIFMSQEKGWQVKTMGTFVRDLIDDYHESIKNLPGFRLLESTAQAEEIISYSGVGKVNRNHLSLTVEQEEMGVSPDPYHRPQTKNVKKNERRTRQREVQNPTFVNKIEGFVNESNMPADLRDHYEGLPEDEKALIDGCIKLKWSWESIKSKMNEMSELIQKRNEEEHQKNIKSMKENKRRAYDQGILSNVQQSEGLQPMSDEKGLQLEDQVEKQVGGISNKDDGIISDENNSYETVENYRKKEDERQQQLIREEMERVKEQVKG